MAFSASDASGKRHIPQGKEVETIDIHRKKGEERRRKEKKEEIVRSIDRTKVS